MNIPRKKLIWFVVLWASIIVMEPTMYLTISYIREPSFGWNNKLVQAGILLGMGILVTMANYFVMRWIERSAAANQTEHRQRRVQKVLKQLDEEDFEILRNHLAMQEQSDGEYETLEALLQQKQKRQL